MQACRRCSHSKIPDIGWAYLTTEAAAAAAEAIAKQTRREMLCTGISFIGWRQHIISARSRGAAV